MILLTLVLVFLTSAGAYAKDIARWTDADGKVHFGNSQFAPAGQAEAVSVQPANGMDVPQAARTTSRGGGPSVAIVKKAPKKNRRGFQGYKKKPGRR
ncbi:MAG: DUF4124 domain-containing protein [Pseudomonadales bacterium]|nr:DUF4124 domain-containing protein [Pseudomonadales bacterium]